MSYTNKLKRKRVESCFLIPNKKYILVCPKLPVIEEEAVFTEETAVTHSPSMAQIPQDACCSSAVTAATPRSKPGEGASGQEEVPSTSRVSRITKAPLTGVLDKKAAQLVKFLSIKYIMNESVTQEEMLKMIIKEYKEHFPVIFKKACKCLEVVFGINVKEVDAISHSYVLTKILDLTYDGMLSDDQGMPKTGLLIVILGVILMEGSCVPEEKIWKVLDMLGVYAGNQDFICGEPRKLITRDLVQEKYLEYHQVPNSNPVRYEFLWGPRAYAETSKMKVLKFVARVTGTDSSSFPSLYRGALMDKEDSLARIATEAGSSSCSTSSTIPSEI